MNFIDNEMWQQLLPSIMLLFKRNKNATIWHDNWISWSFNYKSNIVIMNCHICDKSIKTALAVMDYNCEYQVTRQHAFLHLKERNLLPFI